MRSNTPSTPVRVWFRPTFLISKWERGCAAAATIQKAALEMSPGTVKSRDSGVWPPCSETVSSFFCGRTRKYSSIRSV